MENSAPRKVLFAATSVKGHIAAFHLPYLEWFKSEGYEVHVAAADDGGMPPFCDRFHPIPFHRNPLSPQNIKVSRALAKLIKQERFDIIHCHTPAGGVLVRLAARKSRKAGTTVLYTAHGFAFYQGAPPLRALIYRTAERILAGLTDMLITINGEDYSYARRHMHTRVEYIPGVGLDIHAYAPNAALRKTTRETLGLPADTLMLLSIGRLDRNKNHKTAIRALAELRQCHPDLDVRLFIAGEGERKRALQKLAERLNLYDSVIFLGYRTDIPALLCAADVYVHLSHIEGLPRAVMEAMACGLPAVVADTRGCRDLISEKGGFPVPPDNAHAAAQALGKLAAKPALRQALGAYNREKIRNCSLDAVLPRMTALYRSVAKEHKRILHVLASRRFFGAEHVVCDIIERFRNDGHVEMAYTSPDGEIAGALATRGISYFPMKRLSWMELHRVVRRYKPDILHAHDVRAGVLAALFSGKCKVISTMHVNSPDMREKTRKAFLYRLSASRFSHIFWVNRSSMEAFSYIQKLSHKSEHLANIVDCGKIRANAEKAFHSGVYDGVYLGRLEFQKDPLRLMRIFAGIKKRCPDARLAVVGSGSMETETREYADMLGISEAVDFLGYVENPYGILAKARFMLMCSRFEGLPVAALEAGALGVPLVAAATDGLSETVENGINGFLSDDDDVLAERAAELILDDTLYQTMRNAALRLADERCDGSRYQNRLHAAYFS